MTTVPVDEDPNLARVLADVIAVVDAGPQAPGRRVLIWHVDVSPDNGLARLAGAWVLDTAAPDPDALEPAVPVPDGPGAQAPTASEKAESLLRGRKVLATEEGRAAVESLGTAVAGFVDPAATLAGIGGEISALQEAFDAQAKKLVSPSWPELPQALDVAGLAQAEDAVAVVLGMARWLEEVAERWEKVEAQRVTRKFLAPLGGPDRRSLPVHLF